MSSDFYTNSDLRTGSVKSRSAEAFHHRVNFCILGYVADGAGIGNTQRLVLAFTQPVEGHDLDLLHRDSLQNLDDSVHFAAVAAGDVGDPDPDPLAQIAEFFQVFQNPLIGYTGKLLVNIAVGCFDVIQVDIGIGKNFLEFFPRLASSA